MKLKVTKVIIGSDRVEADGVFILDCHPFLCSVRYAVRWIACSFLKLFALCFFFSVRAYMLNF